MPNTSLPDSAPAPAPDTREIRPGLCQRVSGGWTNSTLELTGAALHPERRDRLEIWLATGH